MEVTITLPDEYQHMIDAIIDDTKEQNPDRDDVAIDAILSQMCRKFVVESHAKIMMNIPDQEKE